MAPFFQAVGTKKQKGFNELKYNEFKLGVLKGCFKIYLPGHNSGKEVRRSFFTVFESNAVGFFSGWNCSGELFLS